MDLLDLDSLLADDGDDGDEHEDYAAEAALDRLAETGRLRALESDESAPEEMIAPEVMFPELAAVSDESS